MLKKCITMSALKAFGRPRRSCNTSIINSLCYILIGFWAACGKN